MGEVGDADDSNSAMTPARVQIFGATNAMTMMQDRG